jgi:Family of unknown function (DUF6074)
MQNGETTTVRQQHVRRVGLIRKLAKLMASYSPDGGERALYARLNIQHTAMVRRGMPPDVVERELRALECAVRTELWGIVMRGGGDAA